MQIITKAFVSMDILNINFEESLYIQMDGEVVRLIAFRTPEPNNIKFGIQAPKSLKVHREEVYQAIKQKAEQLYSSD